MPHKYKKEFNSYHNGYGKSKYRQLKEHYIEKLGGKCVCCGSDKDLQFDHIDPSTKVKSFAEIWSYSKEIVDAEMDKCQLLCKYCHTHKSIKEKGHHDHEAEGTKHGITAYTHYGCRCNICREANRYHINKSRQKKKLENPTS